MRGLLIILILAAVIICLLFIARVGKKSSVVKEAQTLAKIPVEMTKTSMAALEKAIESFMATEGRTPANLNELRSKSLIIISPVDAWGRSIKYERLSDSGFRLISAGKDGVFHTKDDVAISY